MGTGEDPAGRAGTWSAPAARSVVSEPLAPLRRRGSDRRRWPA